MTHHETLLARKAEIELWFRDRERAPAVRLPDQMDETRWLDDQRVGDAEMRAHCAEMERIKTAITAWMLGWGGRCATCGKPISAARLAAVPEAVLCVRCQAEEDAEKPLAQNHYRIAPHWTGEVLERKTQGYGMAKYRVGK